MSEIQTKVLERMNQIFAQEKAPAVLRKKGEDGTPVDILTTLHTDFGMKNDEIMGEFYFMDMPGVTQSQYFVCTLTLTENLEQGYLEELSYVISMVNCYLPYGAFSFDLSNSMLVYKLTNILPVDMTEDQLFDQVNICMGHAIEMTQKYIDTILDLSEGALSIEEALEDFFPNRENK